MVGIFDGTDPAPLALHRPSKKTTPCLETHLREYYTRQTHSARTYQAPRPSLCDFWCLVMTLMKLAIRTRRGGDAGTCREVSQLPLLSTGPDKPSGAAERGLCSLQCRADYSLRGEKILLVLVLQCCYGAVMVLLQCYYDPLFVCLAWGSNFSTTCKHTVRTCCSFAFSFFPLFLFTDQSNDHRSPRKNCWYRTCATATSRKPSRSQAAPCRRRN